MGCGEASREEDLLPLYVYAGAHHIPSGEEGPVILPTTIGMELLAIITMVAIAVGLPSAGSHQREVLVLSCEQDDLKKQPSEGSAYRTHVKVFPGSYTCDCSLICRQPSFKTFKMLKHADVKMPHQSAPALTRAACSS